MYVYLCSREILRRDLFSLYRLYQKALLSSKGEKSNERFFFIATFAIMYFTKAIVTMTTV